jgi:hypothetical protein
MAPVLSCLSYARGKPLALAKHVREEWTYVAVALPCMEHCR